MVLSRNGGGGFFRISCSILVTSIGFRRVPQEAAVTRNAQDRSRVHHDGACRGLVWFGLGGCETRKQKRKKDETRNANNNNADHETNSY